MTFIDKAKLVEVQQITLNEDVETVICEPAIVLIDKSKEIISEKKINKLDLDCEELVSISKEIRTLMYTVINNLIYKRKDNAEKVLQDAEIWKLLISDSKKTEGGNVELHSTSISLLVSALELFDKFEVTTFS